MSVEVARIDKPRLKAQLARRLVVAWLGDAGVAPVAASLADVDLMPLREAGRATLDLVHVGADAIGDLDELRRSLPGTPLVLDLRAHGAELSAVAAYRARTADSILVCSVGDLLELRRRRPELGSRASVVRRHVDLDAILPLAELEARDEDGVRRFRRFHRLAAPLVLYIGPYTEAGGLDLLLDAVSKLSLQGVDVRLAAIPDGRIEREYLDRCERRALGLGHHAMVERSVSASGRALWLALAAVVSLPLRRRVGTQAAQLAAAAGRPIVGSELSPLSEQVEDGETGYLLPAGEAETLRSALEALIGDPEEAASLGRRAREKAEREWSPAAVGAALRQAWVDVAEHGS
jgi:glycosyltransferase involved in cell wall biosynthesis